MLKRKLDDNIATLENAEQKLPRKENEEFNEDIRNCSDILFEDEMLKIQDSLNKELRSFKCDVPVKYVYNPLEYAHLCNETYIRKYCRSRKKIIFVGMNPGPFGMCQTGVPFGEIKSVRDWLLIEERVGKPDTECPHRPIKGFNCEKTEVSGDRFWNLFKKICETPDLMFANGFVYNYCPLAFMKDNGTNITPAELKNKKILEEICDRYYLRVIELLQPEIIVGIGRYAEKKTLVVLKNSSLNIKILCMPHPSPRAVNNQDWPEKAKRFLIDNDLIKFFI